MAESDFGTQLLTQGWVEGHAPEGVKAERVKYRTEEGNWEAFHKPNPVQDWVTIERGPCILTFVHDAHRFPITMTENGTEKHYIQACPGVTAKVIEYWEVTDKGTSMMIRCDLPSKEAADTLAKEYRDAKADQNLVVQTVVRQQPGEFGGPTSYLIRSRIGRR